MKLNTFTKALFTKTACGLAAGAMLIACSPANDSSTTGVNDVPPALLVAGAEERLDIYQSVELEADLSHLTDKQRKIVTLLIDASVIMDDLFWRQAYPGNRE